MTCQQGKMNSGGGQKFTQKLVNQDPVFDRRLKVHRPNKRRLKNKAGNWIE